MKQMQDFLGYPIRAEKTQGPTTTPTIMGMTFDTENGTITIPDDKCSRYLHDLHHLYTTKPLDDLTPRLTTIPRLRSLLGKLVHVTNIVYTGRTRLFHLFKCLKGALKSARTALGSRATRMKIFPGRLNLVHLSTAAQDDVRFWIAIFSQMPRRRLLRRRLPFADPLQVCRVVTTDASAWGVGGTYFDTTGVGWYFSHAWNPQYAVPHSTYGELLALVIAVALWDRDWEGHHILWRTDCKPHVTGLYRIRVKAPELLPIHDFIDLRSVNGLYQYAPRFIKGIDNTVADHLSRGIYIDEELRSMKRCRLDMSTLPTTFGTKLLH